MGKAMALLGVGAGGTAAAAGGNYAFGDPIGKALWKKPAETKEEVAEEKVVDAQEAEEEEEEQAQKHCVEDYFPGLDLNHEQEDTNKWKTKLITTTSKLQQSFFEFPTTGKDATPKSCLFVSWTKDKNTSTNKWEGDFSWTWSFTKGTKGIIWQVQGTTPTDKPGNYLTRTGYLYFLKKEGDDWTVHKHKSLASTSTLPQKFDKTNFKDKFPTVGEAITEKTSFGDDKDNWGFMSGDGDFDNIQAPSDSDSTTQTWFKGHWEWEPSTETNAKKLTDWSSNSTQWISEIYSEVATKNKVKKHFEDMKGTWTKKSLAGSQIANSNP